MENELRNDTELCEMRNASDPAGTKYQNNIPVLDFKVHEQFFISLAP